MDDQASSGAAVCGDGVTIKECQNMIQRSLRTPMVKFLKEHLDKAGCKISDNFIKAVNCDKQISGGYLRGVGIMVCSNYMNLQDEVNQVVIHELIHAFDDCRAANLDWTNCAHHACSEIRAGHLSGDCHYKREFLRGFMKLRGHEQECVRRRVMKSVVANPYCSEGAAKDAMEAVWDILGASSPHSHHEAGVNRLWDKHQQKKRADHPAFGWLAEDYSVPHRRRPVHNDFKP